jgi:seryl-tRNA synthetase
VRAALARRGDEAGIERVLELDARWRELTQELEQVQAELNEASRGRTGPPTPEERGALAALSERGRTLSDEQRAIETERDAALAAVPNLPDEDAPPEDTVLREVGESGRTGRDHLELAGPRIDMDTAAKVSGARFAYRIGDVALLELALYRFALDRLVTRGFTPVLPPVLVREEAMYGTGFFPTDEVNIYAVERDDLYLVGTSEVPLASLHAGDILEEAALPVRYAGFSTCFRREAGAAGKDTRGIFRVHQFDKVELFAFVRPEDSRDEHERLLRIEEGIMQALGVPYRVVNIAAHDLGASAAKKYDLEAWLPGQERFRELTSCSNTTDYQARRLAVRYRPEGGGKPAIAHTLNGTAVAVGRTIIALLENGQRDDGSVALPEVLTNHGAPPELPPAD